MVMREWLDSRSLFVFIFVLIQVQFTLSDCGGRNLGKEIVEVLIWSGGSWAGFTYGDIFPEPNYLGDTIDKSESILNLIFSNDKAVWNCPVDCRYTVDKNRVGNVDAVIFEAQPITSK
jgi:hypothetical protein